jgi:hypothetical protein
LKKSRTDGDNGNGPSGSYHVEANVKVNDDTTALVQLVPFKVCRQLLSRQVTHTGDYYADAYYNSTTTDSNCILKTTEKLQIP